MKVLPAPEAVRTVLVLGLDAERRDPRRWRGAQLALRGVRRGLPARRRSRRARASTGRAAARAPPRRRCVSRAIAALVAQRTAWGCARCRGAAPLDELHTMRQRGALARDPRRGRCCRSGRGACLADLGRRPPRVAALPTRLPGARRDRFLDWGGGLVWLATRARDADAGAGVARRSRARRRPRHAAARRRRAARRAAGVRARSRPRSPRCPARVKDAFDPAPHPQPRPHGTPGSEEESRCRPSSRLAQLADPDFAASREDPPQLRALRLLHRDLPDLRAARRRAR